MHAWKTPSCFGKTSSLPYRGLALGLGILLTAWSAAAAQEPPYARRGPSAIIAALDSNGDATIDETEIAQAPKSLASLDQDGDGTLRRDEFRQSAKPAAAPATPREIPAASGKKPNILIIIPDDLGWNDVGFHDSKATTPNLDRLAAEGTELTRFYTYAVCSPSRAALLTGRMPLRFGIVDPLSPRQSGIPQGILTLPEAFRSAGYQTSLIGKWHLGEQRGPLACGFEHFYGHLGPSIDYYQHTNPRGAPDWQRDGKPLQETGYSTDLIADEAIRQLTARDASHPFFMQIAFNAPHVPLAAPAELVAKHQNGGGLYAAVIDAMDLAIGRVLTALDAQGLREDTLIVFFSDNGGGRRYSNSAPLRDGKGSIHEGGIRNLCLVRWSGKTSTGSKNEQPVSLHDLLPTLAAATGISLPAGTSLDGSNQWPAISSGKTITREPILIASRDLALIDGNWKLIQWASGKKSLYDLKADISETTDLTPSQPEVAKRLAAKLATLKQGLPATPAAKPKGRPF